MMMNYNPYWMLCVFLSHFFIDKFGLGKYWLMLIEGRSLKQFLTDTKNKSIDGIDVIQGSFGTLVYTIVDNTLHIIIMYVCYKCLFGN